MPTSEMQADESERHDRQIRLWGDKAQAAIKGATICCFGSGALATEILKNLVLAGVQYVEIIDDAEVTADDMQCALFPQDSLGKWRTEVLAAFLQELDDDLIVACSRVAKDPENLVNNSIVIDTNAAGIEFVDDLHSCGTPVIFGMVGGDVGFMHNYNGSEDALEMLQQCDARDIQHEPTRLLFERMFDNEEGPQLICVASIMGGIISDEAIKHVTRNAVTKDGKRPRSLVDDALLYDGATCSTTTLKL